MLYEVKYTCKLHGRETTGCAFYSDKNDKLTDKELEERIGGNNYSATNHAIRDLKVTEVKRHSNKKNPKSKT